MTKEEFLKEKKEINEMQRKILERTNELYKIYIEDNQPFPIKSKVKVTEVVNNPISGTSIKVYYARVVRYEIEEDDVNPVLSLIDSNGKTKRGRLWINKFRTKIELCEEFDNLKTVVS